MCLTAPLHPQSLFSYVQSVVDRNIEVFVVLQGKERQEVRSKESSVRPNGRKSNISNSTRYHLILLFLFPFDFAPTKYIFALTELKTKTIIRTHNTYNNHVSKLWSEDN